MIHLFQLKCDQTMTMFDVLNQAYSYQNRHCSCCVGVACPLSSYASNMHTVGVYYDHIVCVSVGDAEGHFDMGSPYPLEGATRHCFPRYQLSMLNDKDVCVRTTNLPPPPTELGFFSDETLTQDFAYRCFPSQNYMNVSFLSA